MNERNSTIKLIKSYDEDGMKRWKKEINYWKRSYNANSGLEENRKEVEIG